MKEHTTQVVLESEPLRCEPGEPALDCALGRPFVEVIEQGGMVVQTQAGIEPGKQTDRYDDGRVPLPDVIRWTAMLSSIGSPETPALFI